MNHTPGPWRIGHDTQAWNSPSSVRGSVDYVSPSGSRYRIAEVCYPSSPKDTCGHDERIANQYLIAAAPDLLVALKVLLARAELELIDPIDIWEVENAKRAILKAEGVEP